MKISSRFSIAVHILSILKNNPSSLCTSDYMAESVNTNPVVIRKMMSYLKQAGFVYVNRGPGGAGLLKRFIRNHIVRCVSCSERSRRRQVISYSRATESRLSNWGEHSSGVRNYFNSSAIRDGRSFEKYYDGAFV